MGRYLLKRTLAVIPVTLGATLIAFLVLELTPADPALLLLGAHAPEQELYNLRREMGLFDPWPVRYGRFVLGAATGDLGRSLRSNQPVAVELLERLPASLQLATAASALAVLLGIPAGVVSALKSDTVVDHAATTLALTGLAMPIFWLGLLLQLLFALYLGWLPATGGGGWRHLVLPAVTLGVSTAAILLRMTRSAVLEVLALEYIRTARAKGLAERRVIYRHALRNALIPVVTVLGLLFSSLIGGAVITEAVFAWPGVGGLLIAAIQAKDFPVVLGAVVVLSVLTVLVHLAVDVVYAVVDPRIRAQYSK